MRETVDKTWNTIKEWIAAMPKGRKIQLAVLSAFVIVLAIVVVALLTRTVWVPLPNTGDPNSTAQIYMWLRENGYPANSVGGRVEVPQDRLSEIQMVLREQGYMGVTDFDDSLLQDAIGFGVTDAHARIIYQKQRGSEIRTTLMQNERIQNALAIVNFGERSPFRTQLNTSKPTASVVVTVRGGGRLTQAEAQWVADIVKNAVPGIEYENITVGDQASNVYKVGDDSIDIETTFALREQLERRLTDMLQEAAYRVLTPIFGLSNMRAQPYVRLNFDKVSVEQVEFFPQPGETEGIVRASERFREISRRDLDAVGIPGTDSNDMGSIEYPFGTLDDGDMYRRGIDQINYDISQTITHIQRQEYSIEHLSIGISINRDIDGIDEEYTEELKDLISKTIGVSPNNIAVQYFPFLFEDNTLKDLVSEMEAFERAERNRAMFNNILNAAVVLLLGVMVMILGRTIVRAVKPPPEPELALAAAGIDGINMLIDDDDDESDAKAYEDVELQPKSAGLEQIERFIDRDSAAVAQLLRNWLTDDD